jgi:1,4-alpha-glucan branching enzyme
VVESGPREVVVRFSLSAPSAHTVEVAGDFNAWRPERSPLAQGTAGNWTGSLKVPSGRHEYLFVIDGRRWVPDPSAAELVDDGFGGKNAVIEVL